MSDIEYKIRKYQAKLNSCNDTRKRSTYSMKIKQYISKQSGGDRSRLESMVNGNQGIISQLNDGLHKTGLNQQLTNINNRYTNLLKAVAETCTWKNELVTGLQNNASSLSNFVSQQGGNKETIANQFTELRALIVNKVKLHKETISQMEDLIEEIKKLIDQLRLCKEAIVSVQTELNNCKASKDNDDTEVAGLRKDKDQLEAELARIKGEHDANIAAKIQETKDTNHKDHAGEKQALDTLLQGLQGQLAKEQQDRDNLNIELKKKEAEEDRLKAELDTLKKKLGDIEGKLDTALASKNANDAEVTRLKGELEAAQQAVNAASGKVTEVEKIVTQIEIKADEAKEKALETKLQIMLTKFGFLYASYANKSVKLNNSKKACDANMTEIANYLSKLTAMVQVVEKSTSHISDSISKVTQILKELSDTQYTDTDTALKKLNELQINKVGDVDFDEFNMPNVRIDTLRTDDLVKQAFEYLTTKGKRDKRAATGEFEGLTEAEVKESLTKGVNAFINRERKLKEN